MQIKIESSEITPLEYFSMRFESLEECYQNLNIRVFWIRLNGAGMRLVLMLPPVDSCWGTQFCYSRQLACWVDNVIADPVTATAFRQLFEDLRLDAADVPETLAGCSWFGDNQELTVGANEPDVPRAWFRTAFVPDTAQAFEDFLSRLERHVVQLGTFFLLPKPKVSSVKLISWTESVDENFDRLFGSDHSRSTLFASSFASKSDALDAAIANTTGEAAKEWLTPRFLEWDLMRPNYPVPDTELISKRTQSFLSGFSLRPNREVHEETKILALKRTQLMQKWKWPVGLQLLARHKESQEFRATILRGRPAWEPLEIEVEKLLNVTIEIYPVIFD
jgi:hypothetical protein